RAQPVRRHRARSPGRGRRRRGPAPHRLAAHLARSHAAAARRRAPRLGDRAHRRLARAAGALTARYTGDPHMRIATWNVNSLSARLEKVTWWLERAQPDVLLMQETKLGDGDVPRDAFSRLAYEVAHHGVGGWNGVAIASRRGVADVSTNFGVPLAPP